MLRGLVVGLDDLHHGGAGDGTGGASGDRFTHLSRFADAKAEQGGGGVELAQGIDQPLHRHAGLGLGTGDTGAAHQIGVAIAELRHLFQGFGVAIGRGDKDAVDTELVGRRLVGGAHLHRHVGDQHRIHARLLALLVEAVNFAHINQVGVDQQANGQLRVLGADAAK